MRLAREIGLQVRLRRAARAGAVRAAGLRHEAVDDAMEDDAIIEVLASELLDARNVVRRKIGLQRDDHLPLLVSRMMVFSGSRSAMSKTLERMATSARPLFDEISLTPGWPLYFPKRRVPQPYSSISSAWRIQGSRWPRFPGPHGGQFMNRLNIFGDVSLERPAVAGKPQNHRRIHGIGCRKRAKEERDRPRRSAFAHRARAR